MLVSRFSLSAVSLLFLSSDCMVPEGVRSLSPNESLRYINNEPYFRANVDAVGGPFRLNLGEQFTDYISNAEFRGRVLAAVGGDRDRVWSDVNVLDIIRTGDAPLSVYMNDLTGLANLTRLSVSRAQIVNLPAVGALHSLRTLGLAESGGVIDMGDLAGLANLTRLSVSESQVANLAAVGALMNLRQLTLESVVGVEDIGVLNGLANLQSLYLWGTPVHGIGQLAGLETLEYLNLRHAGIIDMNELAGFNHINSLVFSAGNLQNIHALAHLPNLWRLELTAVIAPINMNDLAGYIHLTHLILSSPDLQNVNVNALAQLPNFGYVRLNGQWVQNNPIVPAHAVIADALPANAQDRNCSICLNPIENIADCLVTCNGHNFNHRGCLANWQRVKNGNNAECPYCRVPLGPLP